MTFVALPDRAIHQPFTKAIYDILRADLNAGVMRPIAEVTLAAPAASIDLAAIAADWSHLRVEAYLRGTSASPGIGVLLRFNGDTGANYDAQTLYSNGAAVAGTEALAGTSIPLGAGTIPAANAPANAFGLVVVEIGDYAGAHQKACMASAAGKLGTASGNVYTVETAGFWRSNAAITSISITPSAGNFDTGSRVTLYGLGGI